MSDDARHPLAIVDYDDKPALVLTDDERWPGLSAEGRRRLDEVRASPLAPAWTHEAGHRLDTSAIARSQAALLTEDWLEQHLAVARALPAYRDYPGPLDRLEQFPLVSRDDLLRDIGGFVPLDADLTRMTQGTSSGSTGRALLIPEHPEEIARTFWALRSLLADHGVEWQPDERRLAIANVVNQSRAYTYASSVPGFGDSVMARVNLHPGTWTPSGRAAFLERFDPQVISGSPSSLAALLDADLADILHPLALVSGATHLTPGLRSALQTAFGCPVFDIYGLHETRPIAVSVDGGPFRVLDRRIVIETIGPDGSSTDGRGEIVVTVGENPFLPLVRYRTGDFGRLVRRGDQIEIGELEGRDEVTFRSTGGAEVPAVELTQQLQAAGAHGWTVAQDASGRVTAVVAGGDRGRIESRLAHLFGPETEARFVDALSDLGEGKPRRYSRKA